MDTMMKSNTSQTVMTDAPSNKPRKPPTCKNENTLYSDMHGNCDLLFEVSLKQIILASMEELYKSKINSAKSYL